MKKITILFLIATVFSSVAIGREHIGKASFYGKKFHGRTMANGEVFNMHNLTAAHKTLPFGTLVKVTNLYNDKFVTVEITDRGPYVGKRIIDLSKGAAVKLDMLEKGVVEVKMEILEGNG